jgi:small GTP-binding protein
MLKKKICMLGGYAVGKTSLVRRFVHSIFSERYQTTIGVKIDKKTIPLDDQAVDLLLWDIGGEEEVFDIPISYLKGTVGYLLVIDGTRKQTLEQAMVIQKRTREALGDVPFIVVINKTDLAGEWELGKTEIDHMRQSNWIVMESSAKTGAGVEEAFLAITQGVLSAS